MILPKNKIYEIDINHIWHPFTQHQYWKNADDVLVIEKGEGVELIDIEGRRYLDGVSSLWCNVHGHNHPKLVNAIKEQAELLTHSTILGLSNKPIIELTELLTEILPQELKRIFYCDSGSAAVEAALRIAIEYWQKDSTNKNKNKLLSLQTAYHGDTLGAVAVGYVKEFHRNLDSRLIPALRIEPPHTYRFYEKLSSEEAEEKSLQQLNSILEKEKGDIAAFIVEPLVQGAAGMWIHSAEYLKAAFELCKKHEVFFICDEVATGFGKTGKMFAHQHAGIIPDMLIMAKGLSAGLLPISAVAVREHIFEKFLGNQEELKALYYGQTFAGNPLAARVATVNLELFKTERIIENIQEKIKFFHSELEAKISILKHVDEIRKCGFMIGIELTKTEKKSDPFPSKDMVAQKIVKLARSMGLIIRPLGNVMVLMPALAMETNDLKKLVGITAEAIAAVTNGVSNA